MNLDYIIVQAGGRGSRMEILTRNKPKALVPVNNLPMIFHLFRKYPDKKFIIIGDYKCDILNRFLEVFADIEYLSIESEDKGNVAGIRQSLQFIPPDKSFMLIWSDLILGNKFSIEELSANNYLGISKTFPCSWSYFNDNLEKKSVEGHGVAGLFIFKDKSELNDIPVEGSFTKWLTTQNINFTELPIEDTVEIGTVEAFKKHNSYINRCRPYNKMIFNEHTVIKEAITKEAEKLLKFEIDWYEKISSFNSFGIPKIYSTNPLTMQRINGDNICVTDIADENKPTVIKKMVECLDSLHNLEQHLPNPFDMEKDYYQKTLKRVRKIVTTIPFANDKAININGKVRLNPILNLDEFHRMTVKVSHKSKLFGIIHGDCTFSNTLIDPNGNIYFIDARGYFGNTKFFGDVDYDWAKMYYSIVGAFDQFNIKNFDLTITGEDINFSIKESGWEKYEEYFLSLIPNVNLQRIQFIHSIIWLSLASHCWEDYDSMCLAFYKGVELWNEVLESGDWD